MLQNMKTFSEISDTDYNLNLTLKIKVIDQNGYPDFRLFLNDQQQILGQQNAFIIKKQIPLVTPISVRVELKDKKYSLNKETAVVIEKIEIDDINVIPTYNDIIEYKNDQNKDIKTNYLGFNGIWNLLIDEPFFQWYHQKSGQGMLIKD